MKKKILILLFACGMFYESSAYITLYGQYRRVSAFSFFCALISTEFCARVQEPPEDKEFQWWPHRVAVLSHDGKVVEEFDAPNCRIIPGAGGTLVTYDPVALP